MDIFSLVTNEHANFYQNQVDCVSRKGHTVKTFSPSPQPIDRKERVGLSRSYTDYMKFYIEILNHSTKEFDIVHANNGLTSPLALAQPNRPIILTLWGSDLSGRVGQLSKYCARFCDEIIVMSEEMKTELGQDAHVIPHGLDMKQFRQIPQPDALEYVGWDSETAHILFPYEPTRDVKNYPLAERVVEAAKSELSKPVTLQVVYGVDHDDVPLYMNAADALLLTSRREGFPNSVKEAMACNLPVVSTDVGGVRDRLQEVENSFVCTSEWELVSNLTKVLRSGQRSNGRRYVNDLSLDAVATSIIEVYERALEDNC